MKAYLDLLRHVMENGEDRTDRTGVGTRSVFGYQMRIDLKDGFPLLTTKKVHFKSVLVELLWFLRGDTNVKFLQEHGVKIWDEWAYPDGSLGPVYGKQWRDWGGQVDQVANLVRDIKASPDSRRLVVCAWNAAEISAMALPPCHTLWQCRVRRGTYLDLSLYARSIDSFLGLPFNIASYALLLTMLAQVTSLTAGELVISFGDLHIYKNHFDQVKLQLERYPNQLPGLMVNREVKDINSFKLEDFSVYGYVPYPAIPAPIAV